jgi:hypothetical protein
MDACTLVFIVTLLQETNYEISLGAHQWTKKMWYIYMMEYYSAIKNEIMSFAESGWKWRSS